MQSKNWFNRCVIAILLIAQTTIAAQSAPIDSVPNWAEEFTQAAAKSDLKQMLKLIEDVADPRIKIDQIEGLFDSLKSTFSGHSVVFAEQFENKDLGMFFKRINVAALYDDKVIFYSFVFVRGAKGWQMLNFNADGNVNHILSLEWPH